MSAKTKLANSWWLAGLLAVMPASLRAQDMAPEQLDLTPGSVKHAIAEEPADSSGMFNKVLQTGCSSCNNGLLGAAKYPTSIGEGCADGDCESGCFPGRTCTPCAGTNCFSRMFCAFYDCVCCPDPCYEPRWIAGANAAFFVDGARPITQMRIRWDRGINMVLPDRAEYFWAARGTKGPGKAESSLDYNELSIYNEAGTEKFSAFTEMPYRMLDPTVNPGASGFGDLKIGTKSLLLDCELIQFAFQFTTSIPVGSFGKGLGIGHVALEPSLITAIKLYPETYFQGQISQWIPIGGTAGFQGGVLHYHFSLNHVICRPVADTQLIGTIETNGWSFQSGSFTDPAGVVQKANGYTYLSIGPGIRFVVCDKIDIGVGSEFAINGQHFADQLFRTEFRWRF